MSRRAPGKWLPRISSEILISIISAIVFFLLDILDVFMCIFFRVLDGFLEGKPSSCYCVKKEEIHEEKREDCDGLEGEGALSESLHDRKNVFREMGLLRIPRVWSKEVAFCVGKGNKWSDCGCESCLSWMSNGSDSRLHVVVKEQERVVLFQFQPYFSSSEGNGSAEALRRLAPRRVWPPLLFGSAFMSWYEHLGRCVCFFICWNHRFWERMLKLVTRRRDLHFWITDLTRHTHHSAWHTMHNVICGGAKFSDKCLEALRAARVKIRVIQGSEDRVVPVECCYNMKMKAPEIIELEIILNADHNTVILGRTKEFTRDLESLWASAGKKIAQDKKYRTSCKA